MSGKNTAISGYIYIAEEREIMPRHVRIGVANHAGELEPILCKYFPTVNIHMYPCRDRCWVWTQVHGACAQYAYPPVTSELYAMDTASAIQAVLKVLSEDAVREIAS